MFDKRPVLVLTVLLLSACGGGGDSSQSAPQSTAGSGGSLTVPTKFSATGVWNTTDSGYISSRIVISPSGEVWRIGFDFSSDKKTIVRINPTSKGAVTQGDSSNISLSLVEYDTTTPFWTKSLRTGSAVVTGAGDKAQLISGTLGIGQFNWQKDLNYSPPPATSLITTGTYKGIGIAYGKTTNLITTFLVDAKGTLGGTIGPDGASCIFSGSFNSISQTEGIYRIDFGLNSFSADCPYPSSRSTNFTGVAIISSDGKRLTYAAADSAGLYGVLAGEVIK